MTPEHLPTEQYEAQLAEKVVRLQSMMAPFSDLVPEVFRSPVSHYRMRAEFRIWHDGDDLYHIIFDQQTKSRIRVDSFPAASELINQLMTAMIAGVRNNPVLQLGFRAEHPIGMDRIRQNIDNRHSTRAFSTDNTRNKVKEPERYRIQGCFRGNGT